MSPTARSFGALMLLAVLTACSSPSATPDPAGQTTPNAAGPDGAKALPNPCTLLTTAEVNSATGHTFADGAINTSVTQDHLAACDWTASGAGTVQVLVSDVEVFESSRTTADQIYGVIDVTVPGVPRAYAVKDGFLIGMDAPGFFLQISYITVDPKVATITSQLAANVAQHLS